MKRCPTCTLNLHPENYWNSAATKDGLQAHCKDCQRAKQRARYSTEIGKQRASRSRKKYIESHPQARESAKKSCREWARRNPDWFKQWRSENTEKFATYGLKWKAKARAELHDDYVKKRIAQGLFSHKIIPQELIEAKRVQLQIYRLLKESKK